MALCLTACGGGKDNGGAVEIADATEILTTVWGAYEEDECIFCHRFCRRADRTYADGCYGIPQTQKSITKRLTAVTGTMVSRDFLFMRNCA